MKTNKTNAYMVSLEVPEDINSCEDKTIQVVDPDSISKNWGITMIDAIAVLNV